MYLNESFLFWHHVTYGLKFAHIMKSDSQNDHHSSVLWLLWKKIHNLLYGTQLVTPFKWNISSNEVNGKHYKLSTNYIRNSKS